MGCEAGQCKTSNPEDIFIVTPSLEGRPTKAKVASSPPRGKTGPTGHQHSISMSRGISMFNILVYEIFFFYKILVLVTMQMRALYGQNK